MLHIIHRKTSDVVVFAVVGSCPLGTHLSRSLNGKKQKKSCNCGGRFYFFLVKLKSAILHFLKNSKSRGKLPQNSIKKITKIINGK